MSAISSIRQVASKRAHADDKDPSEPPKQQPRLEHFVGRLNESKSESIFHWIARS